ncbi:GGDEF domain-containing protein [Massilia sp. SR12]
MFVFDLATAITLIGFLSIMVACTFRGMHDRALGTSAGGQWALSALFGGMAALVAASARELPYFVETVLDNTLLVISLAFIHRGTAIFSGTLRPLWHYAAFITLAGLGFAWLSYVAPNVDHRIALICACRAFCYLDCMRMLRRPGLPEGTRYLLAVLALGAAWSLVRLAHVLLAPSQINTFLSGGTELALMVSAGGILQVLINATQFRLESERIRDELAHHAQRLETKRDTLRNEVTERTAELTRLASTDSLSGLANRRHFMESGQREMARARRHKRPLAVLMLDIDHFKRINDTFGHAAGDKVIEQVAQACRARTRNIDLAGRLGGEEFALLLPETGATAAQVLAERIRHAIATLDARQHGLPFPVSVSIGIAVLEAGDASLEALLARADQVLYRAKSLGRNQVQMAGAA